MATAKRRTLEKYSARARIAKALAHPSRLLMLDLLQSQEMCVGDLTEAVGADQSTVSKHLSLLREAGLIDLRRDGTTNYYRVCCGCLGSFFACLESVLKSDLKRRQNAID